MLFNLGLGLALTNWNSIAFIVVGMVVMYVYRVHVEEQALLEIHRGDYREYMQHTKRFVTFLFSNRPWRRRQHGGCIAPAHGRC